MKFLGTPGKFEQRLSGQHNFSALPKQMRASRSIRASLNQDEKNLQKNEDTELFIAGNGASNVRGEPRILLSDPYGYANREK